MEQNPQKDVSFMLDGMTKRTIDLPKLRMKAKYWEVEFPMCCGVCGRDPKNSDNTHPLRFCASCRNMHRYCDVACQLRAWNEHKIECRMTCSWCSQIGSSNLPKCECKLRRYCNTRCQELDWKARHKRTCTFSSQAVPPPETNIEGVFHMHVEGEANARPATSRETAIWSEIWTRIGHWDDN
jgi:hypothetical protein